MNNNKNIRRLLQINVTANWGSTGKIAEQIGMLAMQNGWESYIAYGRSMNPSKSHLIKIGSACDVYCHYALGGFLDSEGLGSWRATRQLIKEIDRISPDVVHLHNIHDHYINYPILFDYLKKINVPVVWTQHDLWSITGGCCYIPDGCEKWKSGCENCPLHRGLSVDYSYRNYKLKRKYFTGLNSLTLVPVSYWVESMIKDSFLSNSHIEVIHNGIDTELFTPQIVDVHKKFGLGNKKIVLGVASEWSQRKGLDDFLKLAQMLPAQEYAIIIVGRILEEYNCPDEGSCQIIFIDRTQNVLELAQIYSAASVFVNPTYQDNYPTTNLEAMACGTPVITYKTGGSPESVDSNTGRVINKGNIRGLAAAILEFSAKDMTYECRKKAEDEFNSVHAFSSYIRLYSQMGGAR